MYRRQPRPAWPEPFRVLGLMSRRLEVGLALVMVFLLGGCGSTAPSEVVIGAVYPLSGGQAATGADIQHGLEMAAEIINGKYDLDLPLAREEGLPNLKGAKIKLIFADHAGNADQGAAEATRLIEQEKAVALIGAYNSSVTTQASQSAEAAGVPFLNPESTAASLTQRGFKWFFRTTADDTIFVQNFFDFSSPRRVSAHPHWRSSMKTARSARVWGCWKCRSHPRPGGLWLPTSPMRPRRPMWTRR